MATSSAEVKRVRFNIEEGSRNGKDDESGHWDFLKYLLTLREEFNISSVVDSLVQKGVVSADAGSDVMSQGSTRAQIETCVQEVMKGGPQAYTTLCEILQELGYSNIVEALQTDCNMNEFVDELSDIQTLGTVPKESKQQHWSQTASLVQPDGNFSITGKKMSLGAIAKETKTSQREFSIIVERQHELENQLVKVMKSLDTAKDMLIRERQEKLGLRDELKSRDEELVNMQRKYLELQKAMGNLRETNNKYHEKVTKLQIENDQLRKGVKDRNNLHLELTEKSNELTRLKETLKKQDLQMESQEEHIIKKLSMIESVVSEHKQLADSHGKLHKKIDDQSLEIAKLSEDKNDTQNQMSTQQRQLNFQNAQITMLQEHMQRLEMHVTGGTVPEAAITTPVPDNRGSRYISSISKGMNLNRPFNAQGKLENSKNSYWRSDQLGKKNK